ncbi:MAG: DUF1330 domain-containing protein [Cyclobacteriaceae bacterium]
MIYITQLIYIKTEKELEFQQFESNVLPIMETFGGKIVQRIRPTSETFISGEKNQPYEVHIVSFESEDQLNRYIRDDARLKYNHLKEQSVESVLMVKGKKM